MPMARRARERQAPGPPVVPGGPRNTCRTSTALADGSLPTAVRQLFASLSKSLAHCSRSAAVFACSMQSE